MPNNYCKRGFYISQLPYCGKDEIIRQETTIYFGRFHKSKSQFSEWRWGPKAGIKWMYLETLNAFFPKLIIYGDNWKVLYYIQDVLAAMKDLKWAEFSPEQFQQLLLHCGFERLE